VEKIRTLVVEDEPMARDRVRALLLQQPDFEIVGECGDGAQAVTAIEKLDPELVFLDVQMPGVDGFGVIRAVPPERMPMVVFTTAYDEYALRAFEVHALDYLLKPFDRERFAGTLRRAKERLAAPPADFRQQLQGLLADLRGEETYPERLAVKKDGRILSLRVADLDWIEAEGNYVRLHAGKSAYLYREKIAALEARLDPRRFRRIHRSTIVNVDRIREFVPWFRKDYRVLLLDGTELTLSRSYKDRVQELLGSSSET
jgi:two-component system LytT family response regulator